MSAFNLDGRRFIVTQTAENGVVNHETVFAFRQRDAIVTAAYAGGRIAQGYLVGVLDVAALSFRFCQVQTDGRLDGGASVCRVEQTADGRLRIIEEFEWESRPGETGVNVFEELR